MEQILVTIDDTHSLASVRNAIKPKSVIRISLCRTAKRNPLIFPI